MTRELKIALIVGFSAVLFVAILLSDHFAKVHKNALADPGTTTPTLTGIAPSDPIRTPEYTALQTEKTLAKAEGRTPVADEMARRQAEREQQMLDRGPVVVDNTASSGSLTENIVSALDQAKNRIANGAAPAAANTATHADPHEDLTRQIQAAGGNVVDRGGVREIELAGGKPSTGRIDQQQTPNTPAMPGKTDLVKPEQLASGTQPGAQPGAEQIKAPEQTKHVVAKSESLYDIAKKYYGNGSQWKKIAEANPGRVAANGAVREGVSLVIPQTPAKVEASKPAIKDPMAKDPAKDQTKPAGTKSVAPVPSETRITIDKAKKGADAPATKPEAKPDPKKDVKLAGDPKAKRPATYTVRAGDTAGKISQQILGTSKRADEILELNNLQEESLRVGMVLKIPSV